MRKSRGRVLFLVFSTYIAVSHLAQALILLAGLTAAQSAFALGRLALGAQRAYWLKPVLADAAAFGLVSAMTALAQYYLTCLLALCRTGRWALIAAAGSAALFSGLFFWRAVEFSSLGVYGFSGLPVTLAALIGGFAAVSQGPEENPWPESCSRFFSHLPD